MYKHTIPRHPTTACSKRGWNQHGAEGSPERTWKQRKRKEKTTLAVTATVCDSTAGISLEEAE